MAPTSPVVPVGQEVIDVVPPAVKDWAIEWFGTADKAVLIIGTLFSLAVIGSIVGNLAVKGNRASAYAVTAVVGVIGVFAVLDAPGPDLGKMLPPIVGTARVDRGHLVAVAARRRSVAAASATRRRRGVDRRHRTAVGPLGRRTFLQGASTVGLISVLAGGIGRVLKGRFDGRRRTRRARTPRPGRPDRTGRRRRRRPAGAAAR